jgi:hypothetical protein
MGFARIMSCYAFVVLMLMSCFGCIVRAVNSYAVEHAPDYSPLLALHPPWYHEISSAVLEPILLPCMLVCSTEVCCSLPAGIYLRPLYASVTSITISTIQPPIASPSRQRPYDTAQSVGRPLATAPSQPLSRITR